VLFNSFPFLFVFLPLALGLTYLAGTRSTPTLAKFTLAALSLAFYAYWKPIYLPLLLFSIAFNYLVGQQIQRAVAADRKTLVNALLAFGLVVDIGLLAYFKYANFFVDNVNALTGANWTLNRVILPLAISFYTFQKIAYLMDSARGEAKPMSPLDFTLFAAFFPQLISGPIVHYKEIVPQLQGPLFGKLIWRNILVGLAIMSIGLFKKTVIADTVSGYSDHLYLMADARGPVDLLSGWLAAVLYTFQLYFDFSGYSDMAIGLGRMFGVKLPLNFHSPLRTTNIADYWRRWHMTLQRVIYAYLFQPLSLALIRSTWRMGLTGWWAFAVSVGFPTFVTFLVVGMWHGAGWTFVIFGVMHGLYVTAFEVSRERRTRLQRKLRKLGKKLPEPGPVAAHGPRVVTLLAIMCANVVFRAKTVGAAVVILSGMLGFRGIKGDFDFAGWDVWATIAVCTAIVAFFPNTQQIMSRFDPAYNWKEWSDVAKPPIRFTWRPNTLGLVAVGVVLFFGVMFIQRGQAVFLYFNF
jgi:alginate O-acetyltransferase complex protein AlgI